MLTLIHYGKKGLQELNPQFHGMGYPDAASRRKANAAPGTWIDRTYYYVDGSRIEKMVVASSAQKYEIQFPESHIYNMATDDMRLWVGGNGEQPITDFEKAINDAGWSGIQTSGNGFNIVALFVPIRIGEEYHVEKKWRILAAPNNHSTIFSFTPN